MKKLTAILTIFSLFALLTNFVPVSATENPAPANSYILIDASSGKILRENNSEVQLAPASLTKMMLLLLIAEELNANRLCLTEEVAASPHAAATYGATVWLETGEIMTAGDLLKSVVMASANDAAVALAEHIAKGSEADYAAIANRRAHVLGMTQTNFVNATGLDAPEHVSTARDMAILAKAVMRGENYRHYSEHMLTRLCSVRTGTERESQLLNTNRLITFYNGVEGIKTGTTPSAGYCLAAAATRNDFRLISVVMGCEDEDARLELSESLLDFGFENFEKYIPQVQQTELVMTVPVERGILQEITVVPEEAPVIVVPRGRAGEIKYEIYLPDIVSAPVAQGQPVGTITATLDGQVVYEGYVLAAQGAQRLTFLKTLGFLVRSFFGVA
jgi:D-alanyl-D-alanine carboxypeptidase (penicillin-binding protein 5/6)